MKRNSSLSTSLKGYTTNYSTPPITKNTTIKEASCYNGSSEEYYMNGFPWPPRSYTCSFCRKEFKSAQALGGHMNVHRRDRARLRQSSPTHEAQGQGPLLNLNLNPTTTTNPNFSTSSPSSSSSSTCAATTLKPVTCTLPLFVSPPPPSSSSEFNRWVVVDGVLLNPLTTNTSGSEPITKSNMSGIGDECRMLKKGEMLRMDLEIGLARDYDLDLELRLGTYS